MRTPSCSRCHVTMETDEDGFSCPECGDTITRKPHHRKTPKQWFQDMRDAVENSTLKTQSHHER